MEPYNHDAARKQQALAQGKASAYGEKWKPDVRYAKNKFGASSAHHLPNRKERRNTRRLLRTGYVDQNTLENVQGWRSRTKQRLREFTSKPVKVSAN